MKKLQILGFMLLAIAFASAPAFAQKKPTRQGPGTRKPPPPKKPILPPLEVRTARDKVDIQLSNVNGFLTKLGPLAVNLETAIADQRAGKLSQKTSQGIDRARANLTTSIHDIGGALTTLESEFRTTASLQKYLSSIQGISDLAGQSEDAAVAGQFVAAKDPLRKVAQKLTDALAVIPR